MNISKSRPLGILEQIDRHMENPVAIETRAKHFYPTQASVLDKDGVVVGSCLRANAFAFWDLPKKPYSVKTIWTFELGKSVEDILAKNLQEMGLYVARNKKFFNPEFFVSGELDIAIREYPGADTIIGIESKSFYGNYAKAEVITGFNGAKPKPKDDHIMQVMLYLDNFVNMPYFCIIYVGRDEFDRAEYKIELVEEQGDKYPKITGSDQVGYIDYRFSLAGIYDRYKTLMAYIKKDILPPSDYKPLMTQTEVDRQLKNGKISKAKHKKFVEGEILTTDWRCTYCDWKDLCRGIDQKQIKKFSEKYKAGELKDYNYPSKDAKQA